MSNNAQRYNGLTAAQVEEHRRRYGANTLIAPESDPLWKDLLLRFTGPFGHCFKRTKGRDAGIPYKDADPLIFVLEIAAVLSVVVSCSEYYGWLGMTPQPATVFFEPVGIIVAIMLAVGIAFYFEHQADKAFSALNEKNDEELVKVLRITDRISGAPKLRDSETSETSENSEISENSEVSHQSCVMEIPKTEVVVGDIVILATGDEIPADGELLEAVALQVDESSLTGEPVCHKSIDEKEFDKEATYPTNFVLRSTKVMEGHGVMRVINVGERTEFGKVFREAQIDDSVKTPLNEQLDGLGNWITIVSYVIAALVVLGHVAWWFLQGHAANMEFVAFVLQKVMIAVTLIVVAVPEGLPMAVTLSLAYSMRSMLRTNNLVRKMHACETMGATTVICTDKTGTLTQNRMQVAESTFELTPETALGIAVNTTASLDSTMKPVGNPTEGALLLWLDDHGYDYRELKRNVRVTAEEPFSTEKKYMKTTVHLPESPGFRVSETPGSRVSGIPDSRVSGFSGSRVTFIKGAPEIVFAMCDSSDIDEQTLHETLKTYQSKAYRTLGFAVVNASHTHFLGVVAISDPVREDVPAAVAECMAAGISVKIVTGDTPGTAKEIARRIGLWTENDGERNIITGVELAALSDEELKKALPDIKVIARARPMDKKRLVETLQALGQVVSVTGDGTNDAPALRQAHVGLSMGDGTAVAKEASDITIIDNSFSSIGKAVMWGRSLYKNIQRFLLFQLTVNVTACCIVLVGAFVGTESPLTVTQMLWINLIMDTFGAMALASLPPSKDVMLDKPRRRGDFILNRQMLGEIVGVGVFFFLVLFAFLIYIERDGVTTYEQTLLFSVFVWTHFFYMFNARGFATGQSVFSLDMSRGFWTIVSVIILGQFLITEVMYNFFNVEPMLHNAAHPDGWLDLLLIIAASSLVLWAREAKVRLFK